MARSDWPLQNAKDHKLKCSAPEPSKQGHTGDILRIQTKAQRDKVGMRPSMRRTCLVHGASVLPPGVAGSTSRGAKVSLRPGRNGHRDTDPLQAHIAFLKFGLVAGLSIQPPTNQTCRSACLIGFSLRPRIQTRSHSENHSYIRAGHRCSHLPFRAVVQARPKQQRDAQGHHGREFDRQTVRAHADVRHPVRPAAARQVAADAGQDHPALGPEAHTARGRAGGALQPHEPPGDRPGRVHRQQRLAHGRGGRAHAAADARHVLQQRHVPVAALVPGRAAALGRQDRLVQRALLPAALRLHAHRQAHARFRGAAQAQAGPGYLPLTAAHLRHGQLRPGPPVPPAASKRSGQYKHRQTCPKFVRVKVPVRVVYG
ncbi:hypothetical protein ON010_g6783 [Phytophthora cinnamomi]|nr:hypothetical protein ON010_g6783 [Phytophthora cinnamomi]